MDPERDARLRELEELRSRVDRLEAELETTSAADEWPPRHFYTAYFTLAGFALGFFGALASLVFNVVGSLLVGQDPLQLIKIYLTFPLGSQALALDEASAGLVLAIGCCLYLFTGAVLGIPFHLVLSRYFERTSLTARLVVVSALALALWVINYYALLSWLQPLVVGGEELPAAVAPGAGPGYFRGDWIVTLVPWWVAALTHLVFGWTMVLVQPLGQFVAPPRSTEDA